MKSIRIILLSTMALILAACGGGGSAGSGPDPQSSSTPSPSPSATASPDPIAVGRLLYTEKLDAGNSFACIHCHALEEPSNDAFRRAGHALAEAPRRPSFKNGELFDMVDAVNVCLSSWMAVPDNQLWTESSEDYLALVDFLEDQDQGSGEAQAISFSKATPLVFQGAGEVMGDADNGRVIFNQTCAICHGSDAEGSNAGPNLQARFGSSSSASFIARKVRLSGPANHDIYEGQSTGGRMPFWTEERLSDSDLEDVIEFLLDTQGTIEGGGMTGGEMRSCASTHAKVGQIAMLNERAHGVAGTVTIVDDCTLRLENFDFDGGGIDVRVYGGIGASFSGGFSMGENLVNRDGYDNSTLTVQLPESKTLDDLDHISIWCVPVQVSFGDGAFF